MLRVSYDELFSEFKRVLISRGFNEEMAGDAAAARLGARSMTAADLPDSLGEVLLEAEKEEYARRII